MTSNQEIMDGALETVVELICSKRDYCRVINRRSSKVAARVELQSLRLFMILYLFADGRLNIDFNTDYNDEYMNKWLGRCSFELSDPNLVDSINDKIDEYDGNKWLAAKK